MAKVIASISEICLRDYKSDFYLSANSFTPTEGSGAELLQLYTSETEIRIWLCESFIDFQKGFICLRLACLKSKNNQSL